MADKLLILGEGGQLSRALLAFLGPRARIVGQDEADLMNPKFTHALSEIIKEDTFSAVINAAAYTQVDKAEGEGQAEAMRINGEAVGELAGWCKKAKLPLVHISTDYVFDGTGDAARRETEPTAPLNMYGKSKLAGEKAVAALAGDWFLFRTSWVYDAEGKNFFNTMLKLFKEKDEIRVVDDQIGAPTYAPHLARGILYALNRVKGAHKFPSGIYHLCNGGETSWHDFAQAIFELARTRVSGIKCQRVNTIAAASFPTPAARPMNSRLDCSKAKEVLGIALPDWQDGLKECFIEKYGC